MSKITCKERNAILPPSYDGWEIASSLTDLSGMFGSPEVTTTWQKGNVQVIDRRFPNEDGSRPDTKPCEHYIEVAEND